MWEKPDREKSLGLEKKHMDTEPSKAKGVRNHEESGGDRDAPA